MLRKDVFRTGLAVLAPLAASLALAACKSSEPTGNTVEMRDMEVVDGTVNDSMTDLDAVKADGLGAVDNAGNVSRPATQSPDNASEGAETVATE